MLSQCSAGFGEHALVLRRTRSEAALLRMSALGGAAVFGSGFSFLGLGVGLRFGQICRRGLCANHRATAADHLKCRDDVEHEHRKDTQRRIDPVIERRRGYQPSVRVFVPCHGVDNTPAGGAVSSGRLCPPLSRAKALGLFGR